MRSITYNPKDEEPAREGWYLASRDYFVCQLVRESLTYKRERLTRLLDAGCGTGGVLSKFGQAGTFAVGTDRSFVSLGWGRAQGRIHRAVLSDLTSLPFRDDAFDLVVCSEALEHLADDQQALRDLVRVSRDEIVITVPAHKYLWSDSDEILLHFRRYTRKGLKRLLKLSGCEIVSLRPYGFLPGIPLLLYSCLRRCFRVDGVPQGQTLPLASRFEVFGWLAWLLRKLFLREFRLCSG